MDRRLRPPHSGALAQPGARAEFQSLNHRAEFSFKGVGVRFSWDSVPAQHTNLNSPEIAVSIFVLQFPRGASASLGDEGGQHSAACVGFSGLGAWTNDAKGIGTMNSLGIICT